MHWGGCAQSRQSSAAVAPVFVAGIESETVAGVRPPSLLLSSSLLLLLLSHGRVQFL